MTKQSYKLQKVYRRCKNTTKIHIWLMNMSEVRIICKTFVKITTYFLSKFYEKLYFKLLKTLFFKKNNFQSEFASYQKLTIPTDTVTCSPLLVFLPFDRFSSFLYFSL